MFRKTFAEECNGCSAGTRLQRRRWPRRSAWWHSMPGALGNWVNAWRAFSMAASNSGRGHAHLQGRLRRLDDRSNPPRSAPGQCAAYPAGLRGRHRDDDGLQGTIVPVEK